MNLGQCSFNAGQRGTVELGDGGKSVTISPSAWKPPERWPDGTTGETIAKVSTECTTAVKLPLVSATNGGKDLERLAKAGTLSLGVWRNTGSHKPDKLFCYTSDNAVIVAEFAAPGAPADAGK